MSKFRILADVTKYSIKQLNNICARYNFNVELKEDKVVIPVFEVRKDEQDTKPEN